MPLSLAMRKAVLRVMTETRVDGRRLTTSELARRTDLKDSSVRRRIDGKVPMDPDYFEAISVALNSDVDTMWALARHIQDTETADSPLDLGALADDLVASVGDPEVDAMRETLRKRKSQ